MQAGSYYVLSGGNLGPGFMTALDAKTGTELWRVRGLAKANILLVGDNSIIILDEDGDLALATISREALTVQARASILTNLARTIPTLIDTKLYLRDHRTIHALDLGKAPNRRNR